MRISDWSSDGCSSDLVTTARPLHNDDVVAVPLFEDTLAVVARAGHPLVREGVGSLADLGRYPWILPRYGTPTRRRCDALLQQIGGVVHAGLIETGALVSGRSEEHTSELQSLMRISYAVFCL